MAVLSRKAQRQRRHMRIRRKVAGTASIPRMAVCVTSKHLHVQFIDDESHRTLASSSTRDSKLRGDAVTANRAGAEVVGRVAAEQALAVGIRKVVFDRAGFKYHGRVKVIADAARDAGLIL